MNNKVGDTLISFGPNKKLICSFVDQGVEFIVIGGLAVAWYCEDRFADDMDLLVNPTPENSEHLALALDDLDLEGYTSTSFTKPGLQARLKKDFYAELLVPGKDWLAYSEVAKDAVDASLFHVPVRVPSVKMLIRLKELAANSPTLPEEKREKHRQDVERLKKHTV